MLMWIDQSCIFYLFTFIHFHGLFMRYRDIHMECIKSGILQDSVYFCIDVVFELFAYHTVLDPDIKDKIQS